MSETVRRTAQRELILDYLKNTQGHQTVDDIHKALKDRLPHISKKTVYRNLDFFCDRGLIKEIDVTYVKRYELVTCNHHHLVCKGCNKITDVESQELTDMTHTVGSKFRDFDVFSTMTYFYGICNECKGGQ